MNRKEIEELMEKRPVVVVECETPLEKVFVSICLFAAFLVVCLV